MEGRYERGTVMAPCGTNSNGSLGAAGQFKKSSDLPAAVHEFTNSFENPTASPKCVEQQLAETAQELSAVLPSRPPEKTDAFEVLHGLNLGSCGLYLQQKLLEVLPLCSQPTGERNSKAVFPLPTSSEILVEICDGEISDVLCWVFCVCLSLNSLWGDALFFEGRPNSAQLQCLRLILEEVKRFCTMEAKIEKCDWNDFLKVRTIDYKGDEVKVARFFEWKNILPALPKEVGEVPLAEVCNLGSRFYVENFDLFLKP